MSLYASYGKIGIQLKVGEFSDAPHYSIGDTPGIPDGVYVDYAGVVVIQGGIFIAEFPRLTTKWGDTVNTATLLNEYSPLVKAMNNVVEESGNPLHGRKG